MTIIILAVLAMLPRWINRSPQKNNNSNNSASNEAGESNTQQTILKNDEMARDEYAEKKFYRERLANFLEIRAKGLKRDEKFDFDFDRELSSVYINELKSFIKDLTPTDSENKN